MVEQLKELEQKMERTCRWKTQSENAYKMNSKPSICHTNSFMYMYNTYIKTSNNTFISIFFKTKFESNKKCQSSLVRNIYETLW